MKEQSSSGIGQIWRPHITIFQVDDEPQCIQIQISLVIF